MNPIDVEYAQTGKSSNTNELGMREMQAMVYAQRHRQHFLVKVPPASGKSRAMMFVALDKLANQGVKKLVCTHATLLNSLNGIDARKLDNVFFGIDEFHHGSADENNRLGTLIRRLLNETSAHILAMTGSYFRGDAVPVMRPEDEALFQPTISYNYYQQLNGYRWLKSLGI